MLSWSLTATETEGLRGMPDSHPTPWECLCSPLGTTGAGEGQSGAIPPPSSSSCYCCCLGRGLCGGPQPWPQPRAAVQGSKVTSKSGTARGWCLAEVPGSCWAILGVGQAAGTGAPKEPSAPSGEVPGRRGSSARALGCQPWHRRGFFSARDLPFLLGDVSSRGYPGITAG